MTIESFFRKSLNNMIDFWKEVKRKKIIQKPIKAKARAKYMQDLDFSVSFFCLFMVLT